MLIVYKIELSGGVICYMPEFEPTEFSNAYEQFTKLLSYTTIIHNYRLLKKYYRKFPSMYKFIELMSTTNMKDLRKLAQ